MTTSAAGRARLASALMFFVLGLFTGSWAPHIPLAKERLSAGAGAFGAALLCMALGAVMAMPITGHLVHRYGSASISVIMAVAGCLALPLPVLAANLSLFSAALFVLGAAFGSFDVAINAQGLIVERQLKRAIMSTLHGLYSLAGLIGGAAASLALGRIPELWHIAGAAAVCLMLTIISRPLLLADRPQDNLLSKTFALPTRTTLGLGLLCFLALFAEGSIIDWSGIHLRETLGTSASIAALAFACFSGGMALSRMVGDRLRLTFGAVFLVRWSAAATAAAIVFALSVETPLVAIASLTVTGIGIGNIAPILFAGGGRAEPRSPGHGIAAVSTLGYLGFLAGPPLIGFTAEAIGLPSALGLTAVAALLIAGFASVVRSADTY